jgi:hypothetical protein
MTTDTHHDRTTTCPMGRRLDAIEANQAEFRKAIADARVDAAVTASEVRELRNDLGTILKNGIASTLKQVMIEIDARARNDKEGPRPLIPGVSVKEAVLALTGFAAALIAVAAYVGGITP